MVPPEGEPVFDFLSIEAGRGSTTIQSKHTVMRTFGRVGREKGFGSLITGWEGG